MKVENQTIHADIDLLSVSSPEDATLFLDNQLQILSTVLDQYPQARAVTLRLCCESAYNPRLFELLDGFLQSINTMAPRIDIYLICNSWFRPFLQQRPQHVRDMVFLDYFLMRTHHWLTEHKISGIVPQWNHDRDKVLFLLRRPHKIHRVRLLYKLLKTELEPHLLYSLKIKDQQDFERSRVYLPDVPDSEFAWLIEHQRQADRFFSPKGMPYAAEIYDLALFQILSETDFDRPFQHPWITEKTWLSIINRRPFIMAGEVRTLDHLESMGFHTFREFMLVPNYDNPESPGFLEYGADTGRTGHLVTPGQHQHWREFYANTRDPNWPSDVAYDDISALPQEIRQELGSSYQPPIENFDELRLEAVKANAVYFRRNIHQHREEITRMVDHNYQVLIDRAHDNARRFRKFVAANQIDYSLDCLVSGDLYDKKYSG